LNCQSSENPCEKDRDNECVNGRRGDCLPVPNVCDEDEDCPVGMYCSWIRP
jgi:hypothetical protein